MELAIDQLGLPLRISPPQPVSEEDLLRFSCENELLRIEQDANGDLLIMSPTGTDGSFQNADIVIELGMWARRDGRGRVTDSNGGYRLPDGSVRAPDAAWTSWQRLNTVPRERTRGFAPVCPEFVIELRSPTDKLSDLQAKMRLWIANGAELGWLIDPERRAVEIYRPGCEPETLPGGSAVEGEGPVAGFVLDLGRIWQEP
jgi:Uma2 family endonuclease